MMNISSVSVFHQSMKLSGQEEIPSHEPQDFDGTHRQAHSSLSLQWNSAQLHCWLISRINCDPCFKASFITKGQSSVPVRAAENCSVSLGTACLQDPAWLIPSSAVCLVQSTDSGGKLVCRDYLGPAQECLIPFSTPGKLSTQHALVSWYHLKWTNGNSMQITKKDRLAGFRS